MQDILPFFEPVGLAWLGLCTWLAAAIKRNQGVEVWLASGTWLTYSTLCCTALPSILLTSIEQVFPVRPVSSLLAADAIICLGGGASPAPSEPLGIHLRGPADRLATALLLAQAGKAPTLVLGGGQYRVQGEWRSEADAVGAVLFDQRWSPAEIVSLGHCTNTRDEALKVARLAQTRGWKQLYLVSSAYHLPRAVRTFERVGLNVIPIPCNYQSAISTGEPPIWLSAPSISALSQFQLWFHETLGSISYRWRRWI